ncbi:MULTISPECIES: hypothetical protein [Sphingomonas]|uniref:Uncharacterized protein n=1 Tax=Sphingomonas leidyi TaxID=68569 RepID=A0A7X5ZVZ2_9SPHN|nr:MULTISPECIES: hypothetical protein [Sphingomonas]MBN8810158.1 hypothetical protein [Sphingomonas sp.]NIJ65670.1 hypothetical protein [Sphingomonas leidyi]OJY50734.1 MAG: hypothetical protein BGP17_20180 [Sphingomonas sp. 67-41]
MSDETFAPAAPRVPWWRSASLIGTIAFAGGIGVTIGAVGLAGGLSPRAPAPAPLPSPNASAQPAIPALPPGTDLATLSARETQLAGKLDQIELRLRDADGSARNAASYATRAERMMIVLATRRALERGQPLGPLEGQLKQRFGEHDGDAVAAILRAAAQPVTLEDLRLALDTLGPRLANDPSDSLWNRVRRMLGNLVVLRQADTPSPLPAERLRRARRALDRGDVEAALAEVAHMPGVAVAESWTSAARRYVAARTGLAEIERAAMDVPSPAARQAG